MSLQAQIAHTSAMIALCRASNLPNAEVSYRAQLARLTQELHEAETKQQKQLKKDC
jgi:hypothetical protein